jgi:hypothetical protein
MTSTVILIYRPRYEGSKEIELIESRIQIRIYRIVSLCYERVVEDVDPYKR